MAYVGIRNQEQWSELDGVLREIEPVLASFAKGVGATLVEHRPEWPNRLLSWTRCFQRSIQVYVDDPDKHTFAFAAMASADQGDDLYRKTVATARGLSVGEVVHQIETYLQNAYAVADRWTVEDLERLP
jgi:hypothetical protein